MKIQLESRLEIVHLGPEHASSLFILTNKNRIYLKKWLGWLDLVKTFEDTQTFIETAIYQHNHSEASTFAILKQGQLIGVAGFNQLDHTNNYGTIGYWLCQSHSGLGVMTKVVAKLLEYGFVEHQLNKVVIRCAVGNDKSRAIPKRLGFTYEATLRECEWLYDRYVDHAVYSILASEYKIQVS